MAEHFDELLAELGQIIEPIQIHRERLTEICGELAAAMEAPEQPAKTVGANWQRRQEVAAAR